MEANQLLKSLENEVHEDILMTTTNLIAKEKNDILQNLQLSREELKTLHKKLKQYRFIDEMNQFKSGNYIRWINLSDPDNLKLTNGAFFMDFKILDDECHILCKNAHHKIIEIKLDECIVFQKLSNQEQIILSAVDYLST